MFPSFQKAVDVTVYKGICVLSVLFGVGIIAYKTIELSKAEEQVLQTIKELKITQIKEEELMNVKEEYVSLRNEHESLKSEHESLQREHEILDKNHEILKNDQDKKNDEFKLALDANKKELDIVKGYIQAIHHFKPK